MADDDVIYTDAIAPEPKPAKHVVTKRQGLTDRSELANEVVAQKIIALAKAGERDPERLVFSVLTELRVPPNM
jgi:hypothetical protein